MSDPSIVPAPGTAGVSAPIAPIAPQSAPQAAPAAPAGPAADNQPPAPAAGAAGVRPEDDSTPGTTNPQTQASDLGPSSAQADEADGERARITRDGVVGGTSVPGGGSMAGPGQPEVGFA